MNRSVKAFNDMLGKGFDSQKQEAFLWIQWEKDPATFWWVPKVYEKHGHATDWDPSRNDKHQYKTFSSYHVEILTKLASYLDEQEMFKEADVLDSILKKIAKDKDDKSGENDKPEEMISEEDVYPAHLSPEDIAELKKIKQMQEAQAAQEAIENAEAEKAWQEWMTAIKTPLNVRRQLIKEPLEEVKEKEKPDSSFGWDIGLDRFLPKKKSTELIKKLVVSLVSKGFEKEAKTVFMSLIKE